MSCPVQEGIIRGYDDDDNNVHKFEFLKSIPRPFNSQFIFRPVIPSFYSLRLQLHRLQ